MIVHFYTTVEYSKEISESEATTVLDFATAHNISIQESIELLENTGIISLDDAEKTDYYMGIKSVE